jgi:hypothetical protein
MAVRVPAIIGPIAIRMIMPMGTIRPIVAMGMRVTVGPDNHHRW